MKIKSIQSMLRSLAFIWVLSLPLHTYAQTQSLPKPNTPSSAGNSKFTSAAGPLVLVEGGERKFLIPQGFFRNRVKGYADKNSWWLEALWPDLTPWRENSPADDKEFHAPGGGRIVKIQIKFSLNDLTKFLNRSIGEYEPGDPGYAYQSPISQPDNTLEKRLKGDLKYGLQPYYVDLAKVLVYLNRNKPVPITALDDATKSRFDDWYIRRDSLHNVSTLIKCDVKEIADPPEASITGRDLVLVPQCAHMILLPKYNADVLLNYRRAYLPQWQAIEDAVRALLIKFETSEK